MRSTLKWAVILLALSLAPETAWAGKRKKGAECHDAVSCAQGAGYLRQSNGRLASYSGKNGSAAGMSIGWSCRLKGDEYDQYRRIQNKSSRKNAETFLGSTTTNLLVSAFSTFVLGGHPIGFIGGLINAGIQSDNMTHQQRFACERLETEIGFKKKQTADIANMRTALSGQLQESATNLGKQIPVEVQKQVVVEVERQVAAQMKTEREAARKQLLEDMKQAGAVFMEPEPESAAPQPTPEAKPEEKPAAPQDNPAPRSGADVPSVSAPVPSKPITPTIINEAAKPEPGISVLSQKMKAMIGW